MAGIDIKVGGRVVADGPKLIPHRLARMAGGAGYRPNPFLVDERHGGRVVDGDRAAGTSRARVHGRSQVRGAAAEGVEQPRKRGARGRNRGRFLHDKHVDRPGEAPLGRGVDRLEHVVHASADSGDRGVADVDVVVDDPQLGGGGGRPPNRRDDDDHGQDAAHANAPTFPRKSPGSQCSVESFKDSEPPRPHKHRVGSGRNPAAPQHPGRR